MSFGILGEIAERTRERLDEQMQRVPLRSLVNRLKDAPPVRDFIRAITSEPGVALIAEVKRASPSAGLLARDLDAAATAAAYESAGAACISVLTEPEWFRGSMDDLVAARARVTRAPVLRKDFVVDGYQLVEARAHGADAALLIAKILDGSALRRYVGACRSLGLAALVEIRDAKELHAALAAEAILIGINNRDLGTLEVDLATTERLAKLVPPEVVLVSESGVKTPEDVRRLRDLGVRAVLVGTALSKAPDPAGLARAFVEAGRLEPDRP